MNTNIKRIVALICFSFCIGNTLAIEQNKVNAPPQNQQQMPHMNQNMQQPSGGEHRPPQEALSACANKSSRSSCSFTGRQGETLSGTCFSPEQSKPLACKPNNPPRLQENVMGSGHPPQHMINGQPTQVQNQRK